VVERSLALSPVSLRMEEVSATGLIAKSDIDSLMICARSLEPFRCRYIAKICTKPAKITAYQNIKLTKGVDSVTNFTRFCNENATWGDSVSFTIVKM